MIEFCTLHFSSSLSKTSPVFWQIPDQRFNFVFFPSYNIKQSYFFPSCCKTSCKNCASLNLLLFRSQFRSKVWFELKHILFHNVHGTSSGGQRNNIHTRIGGTPLQSKWSFTNEIID